MYKYGLGQLKVSDTSLFLIGCDPVSTDLYFYKFTFSQTAPDWAFKMVCSSPPCTTYYSESLLSASTIYTLFTFGNPKSLYFTSFSLSGSHISSTYKSSVGCSNGPYRSTLKGNYIVTSLLWTNGYLFVYNLQTEKITMKYFMGKYSLGIETDETGR